MDAGYAFDLDSRALSFGMPAGGKAVESLPEGDWSLSTYAGKRKVGCGKPEDIGRIRSALSGCITDDVPVYHVYGGIDICCMGTMRDVLDEWKGNTTRVGPIGRLDLSDLLVSAPYATDEFSDEKTVKTDMGQVLDMLDFRPGAAKTAKLHESKMYERLFESRPELGMKVVRYTKTDASGNAKDEFRYLTTTKKDRKGGFVGRDYASDAVRALAEYDSLIKKGDIESTLKARQIAEDYFSAEGYRRAERTIADLTKAQFSRIDLGRLRARRKEMFGERDTSAKRMEEARVALKTYNKLLNGSSWSDLTTAMALARTYFKPDAVNCAFDEVRSRVEKKAVDIGEIVKNLGIVHPDNAERAYHVLRKSGKEYNLGLAKGIGEMYFNLEKKASMPPPIPADAKARRNVPPPIPADAKVRRKTPPPLPKRPRMKRPTVPEIPSLKMANTLQPGDILPRLPCTTKFPDESTVTRLPKYSLYAA
ncbi:hypothetical protein KY363_03060 [Candidatus Woesearchaeota archaeon]|nr:hypothetical protein [Candidatus Woesearchaeota archaeon]